MENQPTVQPPPISQPPIASTPTPSILSVQEVQNQKPSGEKKILLWLIIVFILFGGFALGIFLQQQFNLPPKTTPLPTPKPTAQPTTIPTPSLLDNVQTYTSSESANKFTFEYPTTWDTTGTTDIILGPKNIIKDIKELKNGGGGIKLLMIHEMDKPYSDSTFLSDETKQVTTKEIMIDTIQAKEYTETYIETPEIPYFNKGDILKTVVFEYKSKFYSIELSLYEYKEVYDHVLTTFKIED